MKGKKRKLRGKKEWEHHPETVVTTIEQSKKTERDIYQHGKCDAEGRSAVGNELLWESRQRNKT